MTQPSKPPRPESPLVRAGLRSRRPSFAVADHRLVVFRLRAERFYNHPYFRTGMALGKFMDRAILFESLAFHLRPIAMTDSDDASIWSTLGTLRQMGDVDPGMLERFADDYDKWLSLDEESLRHYWPDWEREEAVLSSLPSQVYIGDRSPIEELWDRVYGGGPHSDGSRVMRIFLQDGLPGGPEAQHAIFGKQLATVSAVRDVVVNLANFIGDLQSGRTMPGFDVRYPN